MPKTTRTQPGRLSSRFWRLLGASTEKNRSRSLADVTASSSASDVGAIPAQWSSGQLPYAAVDGDPRTMWESGGWSGPVGQWIRLRFVSPVDPGSIRVAFAGWPLAGPPVTRVVVRTAAGRVTDRVQVTGSPQALRADRKSVV